MQYNDKPIGTPRVDWGQERVEHCAECFAKVEPAIRKLESENLNTELWEHNDRARTIKKLCSNETEAENAIAVALPAPISFLIYKFHAFRAVAVKPEGQ